MENIFAKIIILALKLAIISAQCTTIVTIGGTQSPENCKFPFRFQGRVFQRCTTFADKDNRQWCSVEIDNQGNHVQGQGRWGHCDTKSCSEIENTSTFPATITTSSSPATITTTSIPTSASPVITPSSISVKTEAAECITVSGRKRNVPCIFPFKIRNKVYTECTTVATDDGIPWCATAVDSSGEYINGNWGNCPCTNGICCQVTTREIIDEPKAPELSTNPDDPNYLPDVPNGCAFIGDGFQFVSGGENATINEFPYAVLIGYQSQSRIAYGCGGSLINRWYVLSAAHCFNQDGARAVEVRLGEVNVEEDPDCNQDECAPNVQTIGIESVTIHENFNDGTFPFSNDIALIRLTRPVTLESNVQPVCLPINAEAIIEESFDKDLDISNSLDGKVTIVIGWGRTRSSDLGQFQELGVNQAILQKARLRVMSNTECRNSLTTVLPRHSNINEQSQICAVDAFRDSCKGDSGGPLILTGAGAERIQVGIVSFGPQQCGSGRPGVYTRVSAYIEWIRRNLKP